MFVSYGYNRENALEYARRWALSRNRLFTNFSGRGGDCTNFVSQCVLAGCCLMNFTPTFGWYYRSENDRAPAWSSVEAFYDFITGSGDFPPTNERIGPYGREVGIRELAVGDVIQLRDAEGDYYHTLFVSEFVPNDILVCAHSDDALDRPLSTYNFDSLRLIHIDGIYLEVAGDACFVNLIEEVSLPE